MKTIYDLREEEWQKEYAKLEADEEVHRLSFLMARICRCRDTSHCKRYNVERNKIFGKRINKLLAKGIMNSALADFEALARAEQHKS